jgi:hypothetical protein
LLIVLPLAFYLLTFLHLVGREQHAAGEQADWRLSALEAAVVWGVVVVVPAELLSLFKAITQLSLAIVWGALAALALGLTFRSGSLNSGWKRCLEVLRQLRGWEAALTGTMMFFASILLFVGFVTPPSNTDSLVYHMARVVHWAEDQSLQHYAAMNHSQLMRPFWSELAILHLRLLWGSDSPAKLVQWFSMVGSVCAASGLVGLLGGGRRWQIMAAAATMSIPMGILQATSTQNDYTAAFWSICLAYFVVLSKRRRLSTFERLLVAASVGVGILTKGTYFVYSLPLLVWYFVPRLFQHAFRTAILDGVFVGAFVFALNLGLWARNIATYGGPYGPPDALQRSLGIKYFLPQFSQPPGSESSRPEESPHGAGLAMSIQPGTLATPTGLVSGVTNVGYGADGAIGSLRDLPILQAISGLGMRILHMIGWNLLTPSSAVNSMLRGILAKFPTIYDEQYLILLQRLAWNHEDTAANPLHLILVPVCMVLVAVVSLRTRRTLALQYAIVVLAAYALLPMVVSAAEGPWGIRYQLPFFVLWGPVMGIAAADSGWRWVSGPPTLVFLLLIIPYLLFNNTRPIIGHRPWPTRTESVFVADRVDLLLASVPEAKDSFVGATDVVRALDCKQVGLRLNSSELEYAFWWLLDAPQSGVKMEVLYTYPVLERYIDRSFKPCAIICTICGERTTLHGLPLVADFGHSRVYAGTTFTPQEGE